MVCSAATAMVPAYFLCPPTEMMAEAAAPAVPLTDTTAYPFPKQDWGLGGCRGLA